MKLTPHLWDVPFVTFMGGEIIGDDGYEIDGRDKEHDALWNHAKTERSSLEKVATSDEGDYQILISKTFDPPAAYLFHNNEAVGFYNKGMLWIDEEHRGQKLSSHMIILANEYLGYNLIRAYRIAPDDDDGTQTDSLMGFSYGGYRAHNRAYDLCSNKLKTNK